MIRVQDSVPSVYYDSSRDFQYIGHLFDLVLNAVKTDADLLFNLPFSTNSDDQLLDLMAYTLGLRLSKDKYTSAQLRSICSVAFKMMRAKGSLKAVNLLCTALLRADSVSGSFNTELSEDGTELIVYITNMSTCKDILHEILPYIVPAGLVFNIKEMTAFEASIAAETCEHQQVFYGTMQPTIALDTSVPKLDKYNIGEYNTETNPATMTYEGDLSNLIIASPNDAQTMASASGAQFIFYEEEFE